jgi:uncharacterized OB-fold protein
MTCTRCTQRSEIADALKPEIAKRLMTKDQVEQMLGELAAETRLPAPRCPDCTGTVEPGMRFCPNCGGKLA